MEKTSDLSNFTVTCRNCNREMIPNPLWDESTEISTRRLVCTGCSVHVRIIVNG